jgi:Spy/CpxP family protein refolding chaperone
MQSKSSTLKRLVQAASLAAALPLAAIGSAVYAQGMPDGPGHPGGPMMEGGMHQRMEHGHGGHGMPHFLRGIELTEAQRDKIFSIHYAQMPAMRDQMKALRKAHKELRELSTSPQYDDAKAKAAADAGARAMAALAFMRVHSEHEIYALLTPEQRAQAEQMKARMMEHHRRMHGMDGGPGMPPKQ